MRVFAAALLPEPARVEVSRVIGELQRTGWPVRWARAEGVHLTLKFYGEVNPERLATIESSVRGAAIGTGALAMQLTELGAFPSRSRPRILWVGLDAPPALELLQDRIERAGGAVGFPPDATPFRPHVTIGRLRAGGTVPRDALMRAGVDIEPLAFVVESIALFESHPGPGGSRYESLATIPLN